MRALTMLFKCSDDNRNNAKVKETVRADSEIELFFTIKSNIPMFDRYAISMYTYILF